ncbi:MAG: hypothetical protein EA369_05080 [Bradymonadales bacterium]|nr:MAG: hypothetical protein EA369_05080 [Bradymonadales bacterium]
MSKLGILFVLGAASLACLAVSFGLASISGEGTQMNFPLSLVDNMRPEDRTLRQYDETYSFPASEIQEIELSFVSADVSIDHHEGEEIELQFVGRVSNSGERALYAEVRSGRLVVAKEAYRNSRRASSREARLELRLPRSLAQTLQVNTVSGDIDLRDLSPRSLRLNSVSGDIKLRLPEISPEELRVDTVSGSIDLEMDRSQEFRVSARSVSGRMKSDWSEVVERRSPGSRRMDGTVGSGAMRIEARSVSGNLNLRAR